MFTAEYFFLGIVGKDKIEDKRDLNKAQQVKLPFKA
jgi:hypothetical protein